MSGTSADGIDVAICDLAPGGGRALARPSEKAPLQRVVACGTKPYPADLHSALFEALPPRPGTVRAVCALNAAIGEAFARAALEVATEAGVDMASVDLIGSHGQTLYHLMQPDGVQLDAAAPVARSTLQVGDAATIAQRTGITCVADFRVADVAAGGQGAPLAAFVDWLLLRDEHEARATLNIGGIANATILPAGGDAAAVRAFDTGPGNMVIDACASFATGGRGSMDVDGALAAAGAPATTLLERLLAHPYFARRPPKTTGREEFGAAFAQAVWEDGLAAGLPVQDIVATVTALTARTMSAAIPADCRRVIISGGGVHNRTLMGMFARALAERGSRAPRIEDSSAHGLPVDAKEAIAFAVLAHEAIHGRFNNLPGCTGAGQPVVMGKIAPGRNFSVLMRRIWA